MLILTTNFVCSHLDGVLKDCVSEDVSQRRLAWRVGVGGMELLVLSVGGGVRERGRCCDGIFSCLLPFLGFAVVWCNRSAHGCKNGAVLAAVER
jgi:hypothetical protein